MSFEWKSKGEMPEWSIGAVSKTVVLAREPRVRIPLSPPKQKPRKNAGFYIFYACMLAYKDMRKYKTKRTK